MMRPKLRNWLASAILILPASCATTVTDVTSVCSQWRGISWSTKDTTQTIGEVKENNAKRKAWCE